MQHTPERIAVLTLALLDGIGIPLALGDPEITPDGATADVQSALAELLHPQGAHAWHRGVTRSGSDRHRP